MDLIMKFIASIILFLQLFINNVYASNASLLFYGNCTACHMERIKKSAPSFNEVKENYLRAFPDKKEFVKALSVWVHNPKVETSIMQDEIERFGLMPNLVYDLQTLEEIAAYIYETDLNLP